MNNKRLIHTYTQPKTKSFRHGFYIVAMAAGWLLAIALVAGPVVLFIKYQSVWFLLLMAFLPLGLWLIRYILQLSRKLFWENHYLSSYYLFSDTIETVEWNVTYNKTPVKRQIPFHSIISVVAAPYAIRQTSFNQRASRSLTGTAPVLYILYSEKGKKRLLDIPFPKHDDPALNIWLKHFNKQLISIDFTASLLYWKKDNLTDEEQRIEFIETTDELMPLSFSGDWETDFPFAWEAWNEGAQQHQ